MHVMLLLVPEIKLTYLLTQVRVLCVVISALVAHEEISTTLTIEVDKTMEQMTRERSLVIDLAAVSSETIKRIEKTSPGVPALLKELDRLRQHVKYLEHDKIADTKRYIAKLKDKHTKLQEKYTALQDAYDMDVGTVSWRKELAQNRRDMEREMETKKADLVTELEEYKIEIQKHRTTLGDQLNSTPLSRTGSLPLTPGSTERGDHHAGQMSRTESLPVSSMSSGGAGEDVIRCKECRARIASRNLELLSRQPTSKLANVVARLISNNEEAVQPSAVHHADKNDISIHSDSQQLSRQQANDDALKALQAELEHEKSSKSEQQAQASGTIEALTKQVQALRADLDLALQEKDAADEKYKASLEPLNQKLSRLQLRNGKLVQSMKAQKQQANAKAAVQALRSSSLAASPALRKLAAIKKLPPLKSESLESPDER